MTEKAKASTISTAKWQEKVGLVSKSYKLKKELVEMFRDACDERGKSQAEVLTAFMEFYVKNKDNDKDNVIPNIVCNQPSSRSSRCAWFAFKRKRSDG